MLIFTSVETEITAQGQRNMLIFCSPRTPGAHYRVEADPGTADRMRALVQSEVRVLKNHAQTPDDDEDQPHHDPFNRS